MTEDDKWNIAPAPKDGTHIMVPINGLVRAYWDDKQQHWVLCDPLHLDKLPDEPKIWRPAPATQ